MAAVAGPLSLDRGPVKPPSNTIAYLVRLARGKFELNSPEAKSTVLSREFVEPGPPMGLFYRGPLPVARSEYTIGVEGCGKRITFVVVCPVSDTIIPENNGEGCLATGPGRFLAD